jgi:hypothetical protein
MVSLLRPWRLWRSSEGPSWRKADRATVAAMAARRIGSLDRFPADGEMASGLVERGYEARAAAAAHHQG